MSSGDVAAITRSMAAIWENAAIGWRRTGAWSTTPRAEIGGEIDRVQTAQFQSGWRCGEAHAGYTHGRQSRTSIRTSLPAMMVTLVSMYSIAGPPRLMAYARRVYSPAGRSNVA